jgi:hypothetical protein
MERRADNSTVTPTQDGGGVAFATTGNTDDVMDAAGNDDEADGRHAHIRCFACNRMGHYANQCPNRNSASGATLAQCISDIPKSWILLDSQSTLHLFCNKNLLEDVKETDHSMHVVSNGGHLNTKLKG